MKKILVIEDNKLIVENIKDVLSATGFEVVAAYNGEQGLKLANDIKPDLIICDLILPKINGLEILKTLKNNLNTVSIPFILITAKENKLELQQAMNLGADDILSKPFLPEDLFVKVDNLLKKSSDIRKISEKAVQQLSMNLISSIPHELRTPLNGIIGTADYLVNYGLTLSPVELADFYKVLYDSAHRLKELIFRYLLFVDTEIILNDKNRLETASNTITFSAKNKIDQKIEDFIKNKGQNHKISYYFQDTNIRIYEDHLIFIILELLENALKFSEKGGKVILSGYIKENYYIIECEDEGRGMSEYEINQISTMKQFHRDFYEQQGLGLGLAIIQRLVKIYKGEFDIQSQINKYTKITIKFRYIN